VLVSYKTAFDYDLMDRVTDIYYPDNDRVEYTYNDGSFVETIGGGPGGQAILSDIEYEATSQLKTISFGNGVVTSYDYDNRHRLDSLITTGFGGTELINYAYQYDPASNITSIIDKRPYGYVPKTSPRRNTQVFQYDDLYRLKQVRYARQDDLPANFGRIDYAYDAIGNMLSKTSPAYGQPGHIDDNNNVNLGAMSYTGGRFGRFGRDPCDPPGPHALTATANGATYQYDDNGNMTDIDGAVCTWDFKDRLVRYQKDGVDARYTYDYTGRRITKLVTKDGLTTQTLYPNRAFEIRPNQAPTKFVFNGAKRVARVKGTLDPYRDRVQRIWLNEGKNLVCLAVQTSRTIGEVFGFDSAAYSWDGLTYQPLSSFDTLSVGQPVWVDVPNSRVVSAVGAYDSQMADVNIPAGRSLQAWPRLEPFAPAVHLQGEVSLNSFDAFAGLWLHSYPALPQFVSNMPAEIPAALGLWCSPVSDANISSASTEPHDVLFYHPDHLGSSSVITDVNGVLVQETANYPFGHQRNDFIDDHNNPFRADYKYTGKEKDKETGLQYFEARYLSDTACRFLVTDPIYEEVEPYGSFPKNSGEYQRFVTFFCQPQKLNPYAYVLNNPVRFTDPTGLIPGNGQDDEEDEREEEKPKLKRVPAQITLERMPSQIKRMPAQIFTPSQLATLWQSSGTYSKSDKWKDIVLKKGTRIYGGVPGQSSFYTRKEDIEKAGHVSRELWTKLQVAPHNKLGYRQQVQEYEITENIAAAESIVAANIEAGPGGLTQYFIKKADWTSSVKAVGEPVELAAGPERPPKLERQQEFRYLTRRNK
jgi:RHS repeat-associated protein